MVRRLFQNYYAQSVDPKYKNQPDFYCTKIKVGLFYGSEHDLRTGQKFYGPTHLLTKCDQ